MAITISGQNNNDRILASDGVLDSISGFNVVGVMTAAQFDVTGKTTTNHLNIGSNIQIGNAGIITATTLIGNVTGNINASSTLLLQTGGSERFRIASAGQLGIGGANYGSAGQVLTSGGSGSTVTWSTIASDKITEGNTEAEVVDTGSDGHFKVTTEGSERLRILSDGKVGIGSVIPANSLDVQGTAHAKIHIGTTGTSHATGIQINHAKGNAALQEWQLQTDASADGNLIVRNATSGTSTMFFDADTNNVGINETSPDRKLHVGGSFIRVDDGYGLDSSGATERVTLDNGFISLTTNSLERFRITSAGSIGINSTSPDRRFTLHQDATCRMNLKSLANSTAGIEFGDPADHNIGYIVYDNTNDSMQFGVNAGERFTIASTGNVGINETSPDSLLHLTTNSSTAYSTSEVNTVNQTNTLLRLENTNGSDGGGVNNYVGMYFRVGSGANSDSQLQYVRTGDNAGTFHFKARNAGSTYPNLMAIKSDGNTGFNGTIDPKSTIHFGSNQDLRIGGQYGGLSQIMEQVEYTAGYTGTHWQFETNNMISWSFDGVLIVYGGGGSSYGSEVTKITIVYSRESGANNSGDIWRNGTTSYNIETLGHGQTGLSPSSGSLTVTEDTAPDGAASTRSLFKLGWSSAATGGSTTVWSKLHGTIYWGTGSSGDVEIQDKDGNIFWDSNP